MKTELIHFKGNYRGLAAPQSEQYVHTNHFSDFKWNWLEIKDLQNLSCRSIDKEKLGDFMAFPFIKSKSKFWPVSRTDLRIYTDSQNYFSADIFDAIFILQSGSRIESQIPIRTTSHERINEQAILFQGVIYFSLQRPTTTFSIKTDSLQFIKDVFIKPRPINIQVSKMNIPLEDTILNDTPVNDTHKFSSTNMEGFNGCLNGIWRLLKFVGSFCLILFLISVLLHKFRGQVDDSVVIEKKDGQIELDSPRLNPSQDTLAPMPWDYLITHRIKWMDFVSHNFYSVYATSTKAYYDSKRLHQVFANPGSLYANTYFHDVYLGFYQHDFAKIDSVANYFISQRFIKKLSPEQTAEMVISYVQEIPYCLVHEGSCEQAMTAGGFLLKYHREKKPCLPNVIAGVQSPYEFAHDLKGDCDTRSLLAFTLLTKLSIPASIWVSQVYGHSVLGVGLGAKAEYYKSMDGIRYSPVELTAKGYRLGMIAPSQADMDNWNIVLTNQ